MKVQKGQGQRVLRGLVCLKKGLICRQIKDRGRGQFLRDGQDRGPDRFPRRGQDRDQGQGRERGKSPKKVGERGQVQLNQEQREGDDLGQGQVRLILGQEEGQGVQFRDLRDS